jgi:bifunctional NMN adenylyltransferase/nudix hydrolase
MSEHTSTALIIGRWQLFHKGHETLLMAALNAASEVIVVIGSAYRSRDARNPFTWEERKAMVQATLSPGDLTRVKFLPVRDYFDDERWNNAVRKGVAQLTQASSKVILLGFKKDTTSYYLDNFPSWTYQSIEQVIDIDATSLRNVYFEGADPDAQLSVLKPHISNKSWITCKHGLVYLFTRNGCVSIWRWLLTASDGRRMLT